MEVRREGDVRSEVEEGMFEVLVDEGTPVASAAAAAALVVAMYEEVLVVSASAAGAASATIDEEDEEMAREARSIEELEGNFMMTGM